MASLKGLLTTRNPEMIEDNPKLDTFIHTSGTITPIVTVFVGLLE